MFTRSQLQPLFDAVFALSDSESSVGCDGGVTVVGAPEFEALIQEAGKLRDLEQDLYVGVHEHRHGTSVAAYLVPQDVPFGNDEFQERLGDDFEPDREESASVERITEVEIVEASPEVHL